MTELELEEKSKEKRTTRTKKSQITLQIAGGAIFGALSTVVAIILSPVINASRIAGWEIALFDPTSWIWIICFLVFGTIAGTVSCITGSFGLLLIDPTGIGAAFKFFATIPLIIIPNLLFRIRKKSEFTSQTFKKGKNYIVCGLSSTAVRIVAMYIMNFIFFATIWAGWFNFMNLEVIALGNVTGLAAVLIFIPIINLYTSALDLVIPYSIVYGSKLDEQFEIW